MSTLAEIDILSFDAQAALADRYQRTHDARAAAALVATHRRLLAAIVRRLARDGVSPQTLFAAGERGLREAIAHFTPTSGVAFPTYATRRIRHHIDALLGGRRA